MIVPTSRFITLGYENTEKTYFALTKNVSKGSANLKRHNLVDVLFQFYAHPTTTERAVSNWDILELVTTIFT